MKDIRKLLENAYVRKNKKEVISMLTELIERLSEDTMSFSQALAISSEVLYHTIFYLADGKKILAESFRTYDNGYNCLYDRDSKTEVRAWLVTLRDGLEQYRERTEQSRKPEFVNTVKTYVLMHLTERISLSETAEVFHVSPSYLSALFSQYNDQGFNDYVNGVKIAEAKHMLEEGSYKIYEIADRLGYKNAFYFNRVFKKFEGMPPTEYVCKCIRERISA